MPGMLIQGMDGPGNVALPQGPEKEDIINATATLKRQFDQVEDVAGDQPDRTGQPPLKKQMTNGDAMPIPNGILTNGEYHKFSPDSHVQALQTSTNLENLPELYHVQDNVVPLSLIWERMAQEAHIEMEELIADLSNMPAPQINGYTNPRNDVNVEKKNRIWDFAHKWRARFIQLGVLTTWSTNAEAVGKLIDLSFWLTTQRTHHREFIRWMGELKRQLSFDSVPAPDLRTALEVLATGKANWVSDLGYLPGKPSTPKELLQSLKTLNTILTIRLTTQQEIPYHLSRWTVRDGRVIFRVKDEFDLDLAVASEDPASQFFFIDLRFQFSPSSKRIPPGYTKRGLEMKINEILALEGLQSCYEFLHELVLEHKLTILRDQARRMIKGQWADSTQLCASNRGIVIQYWTNKPGKKNWIEIAVSSGKVKESSTTGTETSHLSLRWHRHGIDVKDHGIEVDGSHLSAERILNEVVAQHTNYIFRQTKHMLKRSPIFSTKRLSIKHRAHLFDAKDCSLTVQFSESKSITVNQDPVNGMFSINPVSPSSWNTMLHANNSPDPAAQLSNQLGILRCSTVLEDAVFECKKFGWQAEPVEHLTKETKVRLFKSERIKYQFFHVPSWPLDWYLIVLSTSLDGDNLWLVELQDKKIQMLPEDQLTGKWQKFKSSIQVRAKGGDPQLLSLNAQRLLDIEKHSVILLSQQLDCKWMQEAKDIRNFSRPTADALTGRSQLYIKNSTPHIQTKASDKGITDAIKVRYLGLTPSKTQLVTFVTGRLRRSNAQIQAAPFKKSNSLVLDPAKGAFAFRIQTNLGESTLISTKAKLERFNSLVHFLETTHQYGFEFLEISLDSLTFTYSLSDTEFADSTISVTTNVKFMASIGFTNASRMTISLSESNPHLLIVDYLTEELNKTNGMEMVANMLYNTLPLVTSLRFIQDLHSSDDRFDFFVTPRSCTSFQVRYCTQTVSFRFEILLRCQGDLKVHITHASASLQPANGSQKNADGGMNSDVTGRDVATNQHQSLEPKNLQRVWETLVRSRGPGWVNVGKGLICEPSAIDACLRYLDNAISDVFSQSAILASETQPFVKLEQEDATTNNQSAAPQAKLNSTDDQKAVATAPAKPNGTMEKATSNTPQVQAPGNVDSKADGAPQAQMQPAETNTENTRPTTQNRPVNMNFRPGLGQQIPPANALAMFQAQQRHVQSTNAQLANMAQAKPGIAGQPRTAPQANMQANIQNRRPVGVSPSPPKKPNGQTKDQPITLG